MNMDNVNISESSQINEVENTLSFNILETLELNVKTQFRVLEKNKIKLIKETNHQFYNQTCIYIYVYIHIYAE